MPPRVCLSQRRLRGTAVELKAGASEHANYTDGVSVLTASPEGLMAEASIGGQTFSFEPL